MMKKYLWLVLSLILVSPAFSQFLNWQYEDIVTDRRELGTSPSSALDASGNLHVCFWNSEENRLYYGIRDRATGSWNTEMVEDSAGGLQSAIILDAGNNVHVAFLAERNGRSYLRYARRSAGVWAIIENPSPRQALGDYGVDLSVESNIQHSVDIQLAPDGEPVVSYFDGSFTGFNVCEIPNPGSSSNPYYYPKLPIGYDFDANVARRSRAGTWQVNNLDYRMKNPADITDCAPLSAADDRFGEFGTLLSYQSRSRLLLVTNSFYNGELIVFSAETDSIQRWESTILDTALSHISPLRKTPEDVFGYIDASITDDTMLHVIYNFTQAYGKRLTTTSGRGNIRQLFYLKVPIASLGDPSLPGIERYTFTLPPRDDHFRAYTGFTVLDGNNAFSAYYDATSKTAIVASTSDGGTNWAPDTVMRNLSTGVDLSINAYTDSVYLLAYDAEAQKLLFAARATGGNQWHRETLTVTERRGRFLATAISPNETRYIATPEPCANLLQVAVGSNGTWQMEEATPEGEFASEVSMMALGGDTAIAAFIDPESGYLRIAMRTAAGWSTDDITTTGRAGTPSIVSNGDSVWVAYNDLLAGSLRLVSAKVGSNNWTDVLVDLDTTRTGVNPVMKVGAGSRIHIAYRDQTREVVRYALRDASGLWTKVDVTADTISQTIVALDLELDPGTGTPHIVYLDAINTSGYFLSPNGATWQIETVVQTLGSELSGPFDLEIAESGTPFLLVGYNAGALDMRLYRKSAGQWSVVSLTGNSGQIAGRFGLHSVNRDLYILGRKNQEGNRGLAMMYALGGAAVSIDKETISQKLLIFPNPAQTTLNLRWEGIQATSAKLFSLEGKCVIQQSLEGASPESSLSLDGLGSGLYLLRVLTNEGWISRKVVVE
ncbi:MAG: T9SS type A sorting domain-containing protein [Bacteroidia bacterium]